MSRYVLIYTVLVSRLLSRSHFWIPCDRLSQAIHTSHLTSKCLQGLSAFIPAGPPVVSSRAKKKRPAAKNDPSIFPRSFGNQVITKLLFSFGIHQDGAPGSPFAVLTSEKRKLNDFRFDEIGVLQKKVTIQNLCIYIYIYVYVWSLIILKILQIFHTQIWHLDSGWMLLNLDQGMICNSESSCTVFALLYSYSSFG